MKRDYNNKRILGIDPCPRGFGFALFDMPGFLTDWGVARVLGKTVTDYLVRIMAMIARYSPDIVALPHPADYRRQPLLRQLVAALIRATAKRAIVIRLASREAIKSVFPIEARTKYDRAVFLTTVLPELKELLPPPRKIWESENTRMNIFDALCLIFVTPERGFTSP